MYSLLPTAYVVRREGNVSHCLSIHPSICLSTPRGYPSQVQMGGGVTCQVQMGEVPLPGVPTLGTPWSDLAEGTPAGGYHLARSDGGTQPGAAHLGYPWPGQDGGTPARGCPPGVPLSQVRMGVPQPGGCLPGVPPSQVRTGGTPARGCPPWVPLARSGQVVPQPEGHPLGVPTPRIGQHMEYLISRGWYGSCVHTGGLSCFRILLKDIFSQTTIVNLIRKLLKP